MWNFTFVRNIQKLPLQMQKVTLWVFLFSSQCALFPKIKIALLFFRNVLFFPEVSFYLMCACVFQMSFFPRWLYFLLVLLRAAQRNYTCVLLKILHGVWFLMYFIQVLFSTIAWKIQFLRILVCLKLNYLKAFSALLNVSGLALFCKCF